MVIDAPHDVDAILAVVGGRTGQGDPAAPTPTTTTSGSRRSCVDVVHAPILLHPDDRPLWELTHTDELWDVDLSDGQARSASPAPRSRSLHTPGHAPGAVCFYVHDLGCVFTGDTLFQGGPGATGRSFSDADLIKDSIRARLLSLPDDTVVHTGHGDDTTIGAEAANL